MTDRFALDYARTLPVVARIKDSSVERVRAEADMTAVVEERTALRRQGVRLVGRCPFHEERTPSFSVNPVDKLYYCFGCNKGGDLIGFVRDTQGLDFVGAVEWLGDRFGITLDYEESSPRGRRPAAATDASAGATRGRRELLRAPPVGLRRGPGCPRIPRLGAASARAPAGSSGSASHSAASRSHARRSRRDTRTRSSRPPGSRVSAGATTSSAASCSRSATHAAAWSGFRPDGCSRTIP